MYFYLARKQLLVILILETIYFLDFLQQENPSQLGIQLQLILPVLLEFKMVQELCQQLDLGVQFWCGRTQHYTH